MRPAEPVQVQEGTEVPMPTPHDFADSSEAIDYIQAILGSRYPIVEAYAKMTRWRNYAELRLPPGATFTPDYYLSDGVNDIVWVVGVRTADVVPAEFLFNLMGGMPAGMTSDYRAGIYGTPAGSIGPTATPTRLPAGRTVVFVVDDPGNIIVAEHVDQESDLGTVVPMESWDISNIPSLPAP
jgi:hypothetical protein